MVNQHRQTVTQEGIPEEKIPIILAQNRVFLTRNDRHRISNISIISTKLNNNTKKVQIICNVSGQSNLKVFEKDKQIEYTL